MANRLAALKRRARAAGIPTIYINDNFGQWRSDFRQTVSHCTSPRSPGRRVSQRLKPTSHDYFVLKPKHSGFFDTTLDTLLETLRIRRVIVTGIAGNICVLFTANDAYMRTSSSSPPLIVSSQTPQPITTTHCVRLRQCSKETSPSRRRWHSGPLIMSAKRA
jgi:nicotinamidase-related amidase